MVAIPTAVHPQPAIASEGQLRDRRRSERVTLSPSLPARATNLGPIEIVELGLGGGIIETYVRPDTKRVRFLLSYGGERVELRSEVYQLNVHELFYAEGVGSRVRYRARVLFENPTVAALNLLYRVIAAHWKESSFPDDTVPVA